MGKGDVGARGAIGICPNCGRGDKLFWNPASDVSKCMRCGWHNNELVAEMEKIIDEIPSNAYMEGDDEAYACATEIAETLYNAGYRKYEWISVEERLPSEEERRDESGELVPFLVCENGTDYPYRAVYDGNSWGDGFFKIDSITHWMPLPEPPEGSSDDA